ncbi:cbb3-type cytochrome oxidase subunit 3 [Providencia alcalifaciens]|nr:cbb3-type cytochrome oxidase subunit 3 [Providencia alcalifaciens]
MDGYSGIIIIAFSIIIGIIILFLVLPAIVLSLFDGTNKGKKESIKNNQIGMGRSSKPEIVSKKIDAEERLAFIIFTIITVIALIPILYILFLYE